MLLIMGIQQLKNMFVVIYVNLNVWLNVLWLGAHFKCRVMYTGNYCVRVKLCSDVFRKINQIGLIKVQKFLKV